MSEAMGVYKVQTIGDAYIAVTGMFGRDDGAGGEGEWKRLLLSYPRPAQPPQLLEVCGLGRRSAARMMASKRVRWR